MLFVHFPQSFPRDISLPDDDPYTLFPVDLISSRDARMRVIGERDREVELPVDQEEVDLLERMPYVDKFFILASLTWL
jgi:hypothetical protein